MPVIDEKQELAKKSDLLTKQDILTPGTGITIQNNVISTTGGGGSTVNVTPVLSSGTRIAAMEVDGTIYTLFAPTPPSVGVTQVVDQGVELARVTIDGVATSIYAPESSTVLSGTSAPSSSLGEDNNLYVQYTVTSGVYTVDMTYVKLNGAWIELAASGSEVEPNPHGATTASLSSIGIDGTNYAINGLPENYNPSIQALKITSSTDVNEYGWGVADDTYYYESAITWSCAGTTYTKTNASPALAAMYQNYYEYFMLVSTNQAATAFNYGGITRSMTYLNTTWYYTFGSNGTVTSHSDLDGLNYIGYVGGDPELTAKWLIDHSEVYFDTMHGTFSSMGTPYSGHLFSGGGSQSDLSDATFDVETDGTVHATDFQIGNTSIMTPFTGATSLVDGELGMVPQPEAGDEDKFLKGDGTWTNAGGNVDDVNVNGVSVLDSNKIAQITSYKEVTQAEYDALPASKESDNVLYCIKDKATADTTVAPIIYSEEEREVGVWTDGKPLYQRSFSGITSTSGNATSIMSASNIDSIIEVSGYVNDGTNQYCIPYRDGGDYMSAYRTSSDVFTNYSNYFRGKSFILTLQYTKTTDTPGSGKYAPSGVPAVHYSENEQVVGTWIDGSTIYEKTYVFETEITTIGTTTWYDTGISNSGIDKMIGGAVCTNGAGTSYHLNISRDTGNTLKILACRDSNPCQAKYLTYRYTKSTS